MRTRNRFIAQESDQRVCPPIFLTYSVEYTGVTIHVPPVGCVRSLHRCPGSGRTLAPRPPRDVAGSLALVCVRHPTRSEPEFRDQRRRHHVDQWHVAIEGRQEGPWPTEEVVRRIQIGRAHV